MKYGYTSPVSFDVRVECYSGFRGEEEPRRFRLGGRDVAVEEVVDRWYEPEYRYFKVRGDDRGVYILRHDFESDHWEITLFDSAAKDETRLSST